MALQDFGAQVALSHPVFKACFAELQTALLSSKPFCKAPAGASSAASQPQKRRSQREGARLSPRQAPQFAQLARLCAPSSPSSPRCPRSPSSPGRPSISAHDRNSKLHEAAACMYVVFVAILDCGCIETPPAQCSTAPFPDATSKQGLKALSRLFTIARFSSDSTHFSQGTDEPLLVSSMMSSSSSKPAELHH